MTWQKVMTYTHLQYALKNKKNLLCLCWETANGCHMEKKNKKTTNFVMSARTQHVTLVKVSHSWTERGLIQFPRSSPGCLRHVYSQMFVCLKMLNPVPKRGTNADTQTHRLPTVSHVPFTGSVFILLCIPGTTNQCISLDGFGLH